MYLDSQGENVKVFKPYVFWSVLKQFELFWVWLLKNPEP